MRTSTFCLAVSVIFTSSAVQAAELPITISKETTYITEPLRPDGYPDYLAALNRMASEGVTPENNAAVALLRIFGPKVLVCDFERKYTDAERKKFYELLGIDPLPEKGDYFVEFEDYVRQHDPDALKDTDAEGHWRPVPYFEEQERASNRPWSEEECPLVAGWLAENERHLPKIIEASRRPRWFVPIVLRNQWREGLGTHQFYSFVRHEATNALTYRAMLRLDKGKTKEAMPDLLACHRLGRLMAQGATATDYVIGEGLEIKALFFDRKFAHYGKPSLDQTKAFWKEINSYSALPPPIKKFDVYERFEYLDTLCAAISDEQKAGDIFAYRRYNLNLECKVTPNTKLQELINSGEVDWNRVLRLGNKHFDDIAEAAATPTWNERIEKLKAIETRIKQLAKKPVPLDKTDSKSNDKLESEELDLEQLISANCLKSFGGWSPRGLLFGQRRYNIFSKLTEITLALGAYRSDHGEYPRKLTALQPKYIEQFPKDTYGDGRFRYRRMGDGFILYSVGPDGKDNDGRGNLSLIKPYSSKGDDFGIQVGREFDEEEDL